MIAKILNTRHGKHPEKWIVTDGDDFIHCWLDESGFHSQRFSAKANGGFMPHGVETTEWHKMIERAEGQLSLL